MPRLLAALLVALTSAAVLVLEVVSVRLVAPYAGVTLETYTAAIGVALAGIAAGAWLGGRAADRVEPRRWVPAAVLLGAALVLLTRPLVVALGPSQRGTGPAGALLLVLVATAPAATVLSAVPPAVVKASLAGLDGAGGVVGRLSALGTLGALLGTFLTGFVLLPALSTGAILVAVGVLLVLLGLASLLVLRPARAPTAAGAVLALVAGSLAVTIGGPCDEETRYYCLRVEVDEVQPTGRSLYLDDLLHAYVDLAEPASLRFSYTQRIADVLAVQPDGPLRVLHVGGGGFSVPRHLAAVRPGSQSRVLELDPDVHRNALEHLGLAETDGVSVRIGDARTSTYDEPTDAYDVVVGDAFGSLSVPWHLATREYAEELHRVLGPRGVYAVNVIDFGPLGFLRAEIATLRAVFDSVVVMARPDQVTADGGPRGGNYVVVASDAPLPVGELLELAAARGEPDSVLDEEATGRLVGDAEVLTDERAPVDQLITPPWRASA